MQLINVYVFKKLHIIFIKNKINQYKFCYTISYKEKRTKMNNNNQNSSMSPSLIIFLKQIQHCSYAQRYIRWNDYLDRTQNDNQQYIASLKIFLEEFPFNFIHWLAYIQNTDVESYQMALKKNSKSFELWSSYLLSLKNMNIDQAKYKKQLQKAIVQVGADSRALPFYVEYYEMISENNRYEFYKKIFTRALINMQQIFIKFQDWFRQIKDEEVSTIYAKQVKGAVNQDTLNQTKKTFLFNQVQQIYKKTIKYRQKRLQIQDRINHYYFDGSKQNEQQNQIWRQLIQLQRQNTVVQNISYCYQRSLMAQTYDKELWNEAFYYLEHETNKYSKVLSILRNNKQFFLKFDQDLYFYWCDLQQRQDSKISRKMYSQICQIHPTLQAYQRYIQFQIRQNNYVGAKKIYDTMLGQYQNDIQTLCYIIIQNINFVIKYYKDYEYCKKLLKSYFQYLPFNNYLLIGYLQFMKNFQNKEGYYDELMILIIEAIGKAKKTLVQKQFNELIKMIRYFLRSVLSSIYLIKLSQRKVLQLATQSQQNSKQLDQNSFNRI